MQSYEKNSESENIFLQKKIEAFILLQKLNMNSKKWNKRAMCGLSGENVRSLEILEMDALKPLFEIIIALCFHFNDYRNILCSLRSCR